MERNEISGLVSRWGTRQVVRAGLAGLGLVTGLLPLGDVQAHLSIIRQGAESRGSKETGDEHGRALAVGDFDGDGWEDLAVGAPFEDVGSTADAGAVVVSYGTAFGLTHVGAELHTAETMGVTVRTDAFLGYALVAADFDQDGYDDLIVGAPGEQVGFVAGAGRIHVLEGGPSGLSYRNSFTQTDAGGVIEVDDEFGAALAAGNWNGDAAGYMDLAVGSPGEDDAAGAVYTFHGSGLFFLLANDFFTSADFSQLAVPGAEIGASLAAGNFVSTSHDDLAIGAPYLDIGVNAAGAVFLVRGTSDGLATAAYPRYDAADIDAATASGWFGFALAGGKLRSGSYDALAIGEPGYTHPGYDRTGRVHVLDGGSSGLDLTDPLDLSACDFLGSCGLDALFGTSLAVGYFDATGGTYEDLAVGADGSGQEYGVQSAGGVYVFHGGANGPSGAYGWAGFSQANLGETNETFDRLGDRVAFGAFDDTGKGTLVASAPGEDLDETTTNIGLVHVIAPWRQHFGLASQHAIVLDCDDQIVFSQKPFDQVSIASTTKAMTLLVAAERTQLSPDDPHYVSLHAPYSVPAWLADDIPGSQVPLVQDETMTLRELMYTCMFLSGNDAAYAIADLAGVSGPSVEPYEEFIDAMNDKAAELGMDGTHFHNPAGLDQAPRSYAGDHYSTPYDMAILSRAVMENEIVREIVGSTRFEMNRRFGTPENCEIEAWEFLNIFRGVLDNDIFAANGIKGGETPAARRTGLFSAGVAGQDDVIACTFGTEPAAGWESYIDDAAYLLELGAGSCDLDLAYFGTSFEPTWFGEFHLDPGCRTGGSTSGNLPSSEGLLLRSYRTEGEGGVEVRFDATDIVEVSIPHQGATTLGAGPFRSHGGIRIQNQGGDPAVVWVAPSAGGTAQQYSIGRGASVELAPFTSGVTLSAFTLEIENVATSQTPAHLTVEVTYGFDLDLGASSRTAPFHEVTLERPVEMIDASLQVAYEPSGPAPGTRIYTTLGDDDLVVSAPEGSGVGSGENLSMRSAAPNPFVDATRIGFALREEAEVGAEIFDAQGREVRSLGPQQLSAGNWTFDWDGRDGYGKLAPTGVYFYRLDVAGREAASGKLVRVN